MIRVYWNYFSNFEVGEFGFHAYSGRKLATGGPSHSKTTWMHGDRKQGVCERVNRLMTCLL
jgi:hypothetical protein